MQVQLSLRAKEFDCQAPPDIARLLSMTGILDIDDDRDWISFVGKILNDNGYEPRLVTTARTLESKLGSQQPDLVVTDVTMPGIYGSQVYDYLRQGLARCSHYRMQQDSVKISEHRSTPCVLGKA